MRSTRSAIAVLCLLLYAQPRLGTVLLVQGLCRAPHLRAHHNCRLRCLPIVQVEYDIRVQLLEIYNENLRDLLVGDVEARQQRSLQLNSQARSGCNVPDAIQVGGWWAPASGVQCMGRDGMVRHAPVCWA